jgi:hypothetical protein
MKKILVLSVGGSAEPIVKAIRNYKPDFVYFFCSSGPKGSAVTIDSSGDPCGDKRRSKCPECEHEYYLGDPKGKAIVFQTGLENGQYEIVTISDPDDLNGCYQKLLSLVEKINAKYGDCHVIGNYTGGTKTMSVAIALVGIMTQQWDLSLNIGPRVDLIRVRAGDVPVVIDKWRLYYQSQLESLGRLLDNYYYAYVARSISEMLLQPLDKSLQDKLIELRTICEAFDLWDTFQHQKALELLEHYGSQFAPYLINVRKILGQARATGYELVSDLLNNAERRAAQECYDDAIARLYRATELFAQIRLEKEYGYKSGDLKLEQLPADLQGMYKGRVRDNKLILGLREDYELLLKLGDPVGRKYKERKGRMIDAIKRRNYSISAHGLTPLVEEDYRYVKDKLKGIILDAANEIGLNLEMAQLPGREIL